jgi:RNA polymerase sigma factor for flagellar operon FliA
MEAVLAAPDAPPAQADELALWRRLRAGGDAQAREELLALHMPYARVVAAVCYARRYSDEVEFGDYLQYASIGLLEALERFDPDRGAQFRTFAARRMHGAILNGLEHLSEKQQQISARQRLRAERVESIRQLPQDPKGARAPADRLCAYVAEVGVGLALAWLLEGTGLVDAGERAEALPFYHHAELRQLRERLQQAVEGLPPQERTVIRGHYLQELPFEEIATMLHLTKGRISQIHKSALRRLRACVAEPAAVNASF